MRRALVFCIFSVLVILLSCTKDGFITGKDAFILISDTAVHFDTVFTTTGSVTRQLKIFNINNQKLRLSNLELVGGETSAFHINVNGTPGTRFSNIEMEKGDSLYVFITVNINPDNQQQPFLIEDSLRIEYNGNVQYVTMDAFGQNAHFLRSNIITQSTTWTNDLPYVLLDTFAVAKGATLTIGKGVQVFIHANTPLTIDGSLRIYGNEDSAGGVTFQNDRLDAPYNDQPGTWQGIYFSPNSTGNVLNFATISNAQDGIIAGEGSEVTLNNCTISHCAGGGIVAYHSNMSATNCLISNSSFNVYAIAGGSYTFTHCSIAGYSTLYLYHQYPALTLSNANEEGTATNALEAHFTNCIITGEDGLVSEEVAFVRQSNATFTIQFDHSLLKSTANEPAAVYNNCLININPLFETLDRENNVFDFHPGDASPCIDAGMPTTVTNDRNGKARSGIPDIGCYEL